MSEWYPASEPPKGWGNVLVTDGNVVGIGGYLPKHRTWERTAFMGQRQITHWMPLPEPPLYLTRQNKDKNKDKQEEND